MDKLGHKPKFGNYGGYGLPPQDQYIQGLLNPAAMRGGKDGYYGQNKKKGNPFLVALAGILAAIVGYKVIGKKLLKNPGGIIKGIKSSLSKTTKNIPINPPGPNTVKTLNNLIQSNPP